MLAATVALTFLVLRDATLSRAAGSVMLVAYAAYLDSVYWPA